jgi:hypothetical protein
VNARDEALPLFLHLHLHPFGGSCDDEDEDEEKEEERLSPMARITRTEEDEAVAPAARVVCTPATARAAWRPYLIPSGIRVIRAIGNGSVIRFSWRESAASG